MKVRNLAGICQNFNESSEVRVEIRNADGSVTETQWELVLPASPNSPMIISAQPIPDWQRVLRDS